MGSIELDPLVGLGQEAVDRFAADAQVGLDLLGDLVAAGQHRHDGQPGGHAQFVQGIQVERIAGGDDQTAVVAANREEHLAMDETGGKVLQEAEVDFGVDQVDELQPYLFGQRPQGSFFGKEPELDGGLVEAHPLGLGSAPAQPVWRPKGPYALAFRPRPSHAPTISQKGSGADAAARFRYNPGTCCRCCPVTLSACQNSLFDRPLTLSPSNALSDKPRQGEKVSFFSDANCARWG